MPQITVFSKGAQNVVHPLHQHGSQITVSFLADAHLRLALTGVPAPWAQPKKTADLATLREPMLDSLSSRVVFMATANLTEGLRIPLKKVSRWS
jgi:hypothetical protein